MSEKRLAIDLPGHHVGELTQDRHGLSRFTPDVAWERSGQLPRLGLDFLRNLGPRSHASELPCWFENLLPERGSPLRRRLCALHGLRDGQSFSLLRAVGDDLIGAAEATEQGDRDSDPSATTDDDETQAGEETGRLSALTGVQLKFSMSMVQDRLVLPARRGDGQWIVKFHGAEYEDLADVEVATMTWARCAGFTVPEHLTVPFARLDGIPKDWVTSTAPVFAVRRFDRRDDHSKVHQEDLCQALDLRPSNKYGDEGPYVSYEGAVRLVADVCGEADGREMARRIGFVIASGNTDAHLKNWTLVWGEKQRPSLSPCYDLVATVSWENLGWEQPKGPELALKLGGTKSFRNLTARSLDDSTSLAGLDWMKHEVTMGIGQARSAWSHVAPTAPRRMAEALARHWSSVPLLEEFGAFDSKG
jgi:serine/threonine-protein kinase HipA